MKTKAAALGLILLGTAFGLSLPLLFPWQRVREDSKCIEPSGILAVGSGAGGESAASDMNDGAAGHLARPGRPGETPSNATESTSAAIGQPSEGRSTAAGPGFPPNDAAGLSEEAPALPPSDVDNPVSASRASRDAAPRARDSVGPQPFLALPTEIIVPNGAKVPAVFLEDRPLPAPQRGFLERVADQFIETVSQAAPGQELEVWEAARNSADQEYIKLYGFEEFDTLHRSAALDALREKKVSGQP